MTKNIILILLCILLFEVTKLWLIFGYMAARTIFLFLLFFLIRVKTMANFRKGTWKLGENIRCFGDGEIITDIKKRYQPQHPKFNGIMSVALSENEARFHLFCFDFVVVVFGARLLMSFHGHSCLSIMIIWIQPRAVAGAGAEMLIFFKFFFFWTTGMEPPWDVILHLIIPFLYMNICKLQNVFFIFFFIFVLFVCAIAYNLLICSYWLFTCLQLESRIVKLNWYL